MLEARDYVDIRFQNEVRYKKPVGIYWLQAAAVKTGEALGVPQARTTIWLYRLPSLIGAIGAVLLTYWAALAFVPRRAAVIAALMMASSVLLGVEARLAKTDAMLLLTSVAAMGALARIYLASRSELEAKVNWIEPAILWTAIAAGVLIKGPLVPMFVGLAIIVLSVTDKSARWLWLLRPVAGVIWFLVLVSPWFVAIIAKSGASFFVQTIGDDRHATAQTGQEEQSRTSGCQFLRAGNRARHARQGRERTGSPWRASRILFSAVLGDVLAWRRAGGIGGADRVEISARAAHAVSARVAIALVARFRSGDDQVAALRAAALSGDCHHDCRHARIIRAD